MAKDAYDDIFSAVDKQNPYGGVLSEHSLSLVNEWIDTGSLALNAICSGSMYKGLPASRIIGLGGPTGCGKTFIMNQAIGNFQKVDPTRWGAVWDSEMAEDARTAASVGANPKQIRHYPIDSVPKMRNQISTFLDKIIENNMQGKFIVGIDSLGNLGGGKELKDVEGDKEAADMGTRAKEIRSMLRVLTFKAAAANTTIIFTNHIYSNPTAMYESVIKQQSGGLGPQYLASLLIQLGVKPLEQDTSDEHDVMVAGARKYSSVLLRAITAKNRFIPQFLQTELILNFKTGLYKYAGLFELAKEFGIIEGDKSYSIDGQKLGYRKDWRHDDAAWDLILPSLEEKINDAWSFGQSNYDELQQEVEALEDEK